ncbi:MAG: DUF1553 domain-containing protein [Pedosphaera sp.]|nr:DUF1553 domain-containing protein [Pedosphaera sp.]
MCSQPHQQLRTRTATEFWRRTVTFALFGVLQSASSFSAEKLVDFSREILPILSDNCFQCHGPDEKARKAKLRLDTKEGAFHIKEDVAPFVPRNSPQSEVYKRISSRDPDEVMPPPKSKRVLAARQIELIQRWIDQGANWGEHWAFSKLSRPEAPITRTLNDRVVNSIDSFIFARLEKETLTPSPEAPRETLIRRATLDLTGLPPTPEEVTAFLADVSPNSYEKIVDRLIDSPAFGERMAWDWLDAARYADSNGYQGDGERTMWPWRDWIVQAFNRNLPYDRFTIWQLAGDLLPDPTFEQRLATGFCRNHAINGEGGRIPEENRVDYVMDMTETMGTVWLGLTLNCCRCHDHKFDPLTRRDYYSLTAYFNQTAVDGGGGDPQSKPNIELPSSDQKTTLAKTASDIKTAAQELDDFEMTFLPRLLDKPSPELDKPAIVSDAIKNIVKTAAAKRNRGQLAELEKEFEKSARDYVTHVKKLREVLDQRDRLTRSIVRVMVMEDMPKPRKTFMLEKGIYDKPGEEVNPAIPAKLPGLAAQGMTNRLALAQWLVSAENPLTARVTVNRFWQQFFGVGLVKTPEDFGVQGESPVHPELLDWLASEFIRSGWDVKQLCRWIVTSATYRQTSKVSSAVLEHDPENRLLARGSRFRMPSWMIRDQALAASGLLVAKVGGPPVKSYQPAGVWEDATFGNKKYQQDKGEGLYRRSLYTFWRRIIAPTMFFDNASRQVCTVKQPRTNTPLHALTTLNDISYVEAARALAEKVLVTARPASDARIDLAFRLVLARTPTSSESQVLRASLERLKREFARDPEAAKKFLSIGQSERSEKLDAIEHAAFAGLCSAILNLDEALTKE